MADTNTKELEMVFKTDSGKTVTVALRDPKEGLTLAQVNTVMQTIIAKNVISSKNGDLTGISEARIRQLAITGLV